MIVRIAPLALLLAAVPLAAQPIPAAAPPPAAAPSPTPAPQAGMVRVALQTGEGPILIDLDMVHAPVTAANFLRYVDGRRMDGITFYRASKVPGRADLGLVQGGVKFDPKRLYPPIPHEPTTQTGILHTDGTISMARNAPGTANGDFFIVVGDMPYMNADPKAPGDNAGFAAFGHVAAGMDIVRHILAGPTSPTEGVGPMKGEMLSPPVKILTAKRLK